MVRTKASRAKLEEAREKMRLLMAAGGLFVLLLGLTLIIVQIIWIKEQDKTMIWVPFSAFFLVGVTLFVAAAFLKIGEAEALLKLPFGQRGQS
jgi:hypothetical protein